MYDQYLGVVICSKAYTYRTVKIKVRSVSSNETFIKGIELENDTYDNTYL